MSVHEVYNPQCNACPLYANAQSVCVPGRRADDRRLTEDYRPRVVLVGEAPGPNEDKENRTFCGRAGEKLKEFLQQVGLNPADIFLTNVCKCFPRQAQGYREPKPDEIKQCTSLYLENEILALQPDIIVPLGNSSLFWATGHKQISKYHGKGETIKLPSQAWLDLLAKEGHTDLPAQRDYFVLPTYHPAATLYKHGLKYVSAILQDLSTVREQLGTAGGEAAPARPQGAYTYCLDKETLDAELDKIESYIRFGAIKFLVVDVETGPPYEESERTNKEAGLNMWDPKNLILCLSLSYKPGTAIGIPLQHPQSPWATDRVMLDYARKRLTDIFKAIPLYNQNLKFDLMWLLTRGYEYAQVAGDPMLADHVLNNTLTPHDLESISARYGGMVAHKAKMQRHMAEQKTTNLTFCDLMIVLEYCCLDVDATIRSKLGIDDALRGKGLTHINQLFMVDSILPHVDMEMAGCALDLEAIGRLEVEYSREMDAHVQYLRDCGYAEQVEQVLSLEPGKFKLTSPDHLGCLLKSCLLITPPKKGGYTDTGKVSTNSDILELYQEHYLKFVIPEDQLWRATEEEKVRSTWSKHVVNVLQHILDFKSVKQSLTHYVRPMPKLVRADGLLHPIYRICGTDTARDSAVDPPILTLPKRSPVKRAIKSKWPLGLILQADYGQIEVRVFGMFTQEPSLLAIFLRGGDVHREMCAELLQKAPETVTADERDLFKTVLFGLFYGRSAGTIAQAMKVPKQRAQQFIDSIFQRFPAIRLWIQEQHRMAREVGYVESLYGWRRYLPAHLFTTDEQERRAQNSPIQSTAATITLEALQRCQNIRRMTPLRSRLNTFVYDSLGWDCFPGEAVPVFNLLHKQMVQVPPMLHEFIARVPLAIDLELGASWGGMCKAKLLGGTKVKLSGSPENFQRLWAQCSAWEGDITPEMLSFEEGMTGDGKKQVTAEVDFPLPAYLR